MKVHLVNRSSWSILSFHLFCKGAVSIISDFYMFTFLFPCNTLCWAGLEEYVCVPSAHEKLNISPPSVKYFVIRFVGSAAQHGLGFFLGLFLCLCALDHMFDSIVGKFYVRMLSQV